MKPWIPLTAAAVIANVALAVIGRDSFVHAVVVAMMAVWVAAPALVLAAVFFFFRRRSPGWASMFRWSAIIGIVFASCLPSLPAGYLVARHDVAKAKSYCDALAPKLEAYHSHHGSFPRDIRLVADSSNYPSLLRGRTFYDTTGVTYSFSFDDPRGIVNIWSWSSDKRKWTLGTD